MVPAVLSGNLTPLPSAAAVQSIMYAPLPIVHKPGADATDGARSPVEPTNQVSSKMPGSAGVGGRSEYVTLFFPFAESCTASIAPATSVSLTSTVPAVANSDFLPACDTDRTATTQSPGTSATTDALAPSLAVMVANDTFEASSTWAAATSRYARS